MQNSLLCVWHTVYTTQKLVITAPGISVMFLVFVNNFIINCPLARGQSRNYCPISQKGDALTH